MNERSRPKVAGILGGFRVRFLNHTHKNMGYFEDEVFEYSIAKRGLNCNEPW